LRLDPQLMGQTVRCPACRKTFVVSTVSFAESAGPEKTSAGKASTGKVSGTNAAGATSPSVPEVELSLEAFGTRMISGDSAETFGGVKTGSGESTASTGKIGRFEVYEVLGRGAFGVVSRAYDPLLDREVALKVPLFSSKEGKRAQRFLNEAKAAARLRHPNIVAVYEGGEADGRLYLAAEYIKGQTLAEVIKGSQPTAERSAERTTEHPGCSAAAGVLLPIEQSVRWVRELAGALAYAHAQGVVHRDIKPHNIMIDAEGRPQIMDFGLAKRVDQDAKMTSEGALLGTPAYMPPEQARGDIENVGPYSDQYSLGAVLYELLTGQRPFDGPPAVVIAKAASEEPPAPRTINAEIPEDLEAICLKGMEKDPARRYANCIALAADLANWEQGEATAARPLTSVERAKRWARRSPAIAGLVATVAVLLVLAAGGSAVAALVLIQSNREHAAALAAARERTEKAAAQAEKAAAAARRAEWGTQRAEEETRRAEEAREEHEQVIASFDEATKNRVLKEEELKSVREERKKARRTPSADRNETSGVAKDAPQAGVPEGADAVPITKALAEKIRSNFALIQFEGHSYAIVHEGRTWSSALGRCRVFGGHLLTIDSQDEWKFIEKTLSADVGIRNSGQRLWIGGRQPIKGGAEWITGGQVVFPYPQKFRRGSLAIWAQPGTGDGFFSLDSVASENAKHGFLCEWDELIENVE
jgi:tRNA A-37 threonylcarbamoyl transferase component Bud32